MTYCDFKMVSVEISLCTYITYGKISEGVDPRHFRFLVISRKWERFRACNLQGIDSSYSSIEKMHEEKFYQISFFTIYQNNTGALTFSFLSYRVNEKIRTDKPKT